MAEQHTKPIPEEPERTPQEVHPKGAMPSRRLLPIGLGLIALLIGCFWGGNEPPAEPLMDAPLVIPTVTRSSADRSSVNSSRPAQSSAALTRVASSLAQAPEPTSTPTPVIADSALIPLPTVTPTLIPSPVTTRTIEISGEATLRLQLNSESFESSGQPVSIALEPRSYVLGGNTLTQDEQWCVQLGPTGLVFDLRFTLQPITENLYVGGELQLYDGFCGTWGNLGNRLSTVPMDVTVPAGSTARLAPTLQVQGSLMGLDNLLNISTGVFLDLTIRNPSPR
jgi:hypothetical protein